jgi:hypothetical protein
MIEISRELFASLCKEKINLTLTARDEKETYRFYFDTGIRFEVVGRGSYDRAGSEGEISRALLASLIKESEKTNLTLTVRDEKEMYRFHFDNTGMRFEFVDKGVYSVKGNTDFVGAGNGSIGANTDFVRACLHRSS